MRGRVRGRIETSRYSPVERRRSIGRDEAARDQILEMGEHRESGGSDEGRLESLIDRRDDRRNGAVSRGEAIEDRGLTLAAMVGEGSQEALRVADRTAMAGPVEVSSRPRSLSRDAM